MSAKGSTKLSRQDQVKEIIRCGSDPQYFINKYVQIVHLKKGVVPFKTYPFQDDCLQAFLDHRFVIVNKSRQLGLSTVSAAYVTWMGLFQKNKNILVIATDQKVAMSFLKKVILMFESLPEWLVLPKVASQTKTHIEWTNGSRVEAAATSDTAGRGSSVNVLLVDEAAHITGMEDLWAALFPTVSDGGNIILLSCVTEDTWVYTPEGPTQIGKFFEDKVTPGPRVLPYTVQGFGGARAGAFLVNNGEVPTKKITTKWAELESSLPHKVWAYKDGIYGWVKTGNLGVGDWIAHSGGFETWGANDTIPEFSTSRKCRNKPNIGKEITPDLAYLLGLYLAEGSSYGGHNVTITSADTEHVEKALLALGLTFSRTDAVHFSIGSTALVNLMRSLGFDLRVHAPQKSIPQRLLSMSRANIVALLQGLFDGDGCATLRGEVSFASTSEVLANQVRTLLVNFGIWASKYHKTLEQLNKNPTKKIQHKHPSWHLEMSGKNAKEFFKKVGFRLERKQVRQEVVNRQSGRACGKNVIPGGVEILREVFKNSEKTMKELRACGVGIGPIIYSRPHKTEHVSKDLFLRAWKEMGASQTSDLREVVQKAASPDLVWAQITRIEDGFARTYDFSLPEIPEDPWCHSVIYNGILGHQTPFGVGNLFHKIWMGAKAQTNEFYPIELPWTVHPDRDEDWFEQQKSALGSDRLVSQELLCDFASSGKSFLNGEEIRTLEQHTMTPIAYWEGQPDLWIWRHPNPGERYLISCLPEGELVQTPSGPKEVQDIYPGDFLLDREGSPTKVLNCQITDGWQGNLIEIKASSTWRPLKVTPNHPLLVSRGQLTRNYKRDNPNYRFNERHWKLSSEFLPADEVCVGDWLETPNTYRQKTLEDHEILNHWTGDQTQTRVDFRIQNPLLDEEFWWFIGVWLAEGWVCSQPASEFISTSHNLDTEMWIAEKIQIAMSRLFDRKVCFTQIPENTSLITRFSSKELGEWLTENFGRGARNKHIPEWVKFLPEVFKKKLIEGYLLGDGSWFQTRNSRLPGKAESRMAFVSVSLPLLEDVQDILLSLGVLSSLQLLRRAKLQTIRGQDVFSQEAYQLVLAHYDSMKFAVMLGLSPLKEFATVTNHRIISNVFLSKDQTRVFRRVKRVTLTPYKGPVFNFETESHTFLAQRFVTHNCDVSRGDAEDFSTFHIVNLDQDQVVGEFQGKLQPDFFGNFLDEVGRRYNNALICVENNGVGVATAFKLKELKYPNLYYHKFAKFGIHTTFDPDQVLNECPGFQLDQKNRVEVLAYLDQTLRNQKLRVFSQRFFEELKTFVWIDNTRAKALKGYHDDLVMSLAVACFLHQAAGRYSNDGENVREVLQFSIRTSSMTLGEAQGWGNLPPVYTDSTIPGAGGWGAPQIPTQPKGGPPRNGWEQFMVDLTKR